MELFIHLFKREIIENRAHFIVGLGRPMGLSLETLKVATLPREI